LHIGVVSSIKGRPTFVLCLECGGYSKDGGAPQACKISYADSLSILIAGRHSIFVHAPRRMDSNWKLEQRLHGEIAWTVMKAALAYVATLACLTARLPRYCNNTVHSQSPWAYPAWRDCGKNNPPALRSLDAMFCIRPLFGGLRSSFKVRIVRCATA
jgi:hypothetical protein